MEPSTLDPLTLQNGYSPLLSLITAAFELGGAAWVARLGIDRALRWRLVALLVVLAGYQLAEIWVCAAPADPLRARLAFVDVTWLPVVGLDLLVVLAGTTGWLRGLVRAQYAAAAALCTWMMLDHDFVIGTVCSTVLATYQHGTPFHHVFGGWYELCLGAMIVAGGLLAVRSEDRRVRAHAVDLQLGVVGFLLPAFLAQIILRHMDPSLPSLMCHFAVVLAVMLLRMARREAAAAPSR